jgi:uncharacterized protein (DUF1330 family)
MSYYIVANFDVMDSEMYEKYKSLIGPLMSQPEIKVLASDWAPRDIEGGSRQALVILEFASEEVAMRWYDSPEYQAVIHLRIDATEGWLRGVPSL